ncbi:MAG TPA: FAD-binding protein, partial [Steroidobacter sp.]
MSGFDEVVDFVVVGSGGGSMCAGLLMRSLGKNVLILEKTALVGGTTARSGGVMWIPNNRFMKRDGVEDSFEKATKYLDSLTSKQTEAPGSTPERRRTYVTEAPQMVEFLVNQGVKLNRIRYWPDYYDDLPGGSEDGRTVVAELFNVNELGEWKQKLQPTFIRAPVDLLQPSLEEMMELPALTRSWRVKALVAKLVARGILGKITGKYW